MINTSSTLEQSSATRWEIVRWWEKRRFEYNAYVGIVGLVSVVLALTASGVAVKEGEDFVEPFALLPGAPLYAAAANLCYTAGWIYDVVAYNGRPRANHFRNGLQFSMLFTALPGL